MKERMRSFCLSAVRRLVPCLSRFWLCPALSLLKKQEGARKQTLSWSSSLVANQVFSRAPHRDNIASNISPRAAVLAFCPLDQRLYILSTEPADRKSTR